MHRYLVRLSNSEELKPKQIPQVSTNLSQTVKQFHGDVRNVRISENAIEFDLFLAESDFSDEMIGALSKCGRLLSKRNLRGEAKTKDKKQIMEEVIGLFDEQRYWECHEVLESIWKIERNPDEKNLQNGIILAASALVHAQKDGDDVCLRMLQRSLTKLTAWEGDYYHGFNVDSLRNYLKDMITSRNISFREI